MRFNWFKSPNKKVAKINSQALESEIYRDIFIDKNQIDYWITHYIQENNVIFHPYVEIAQVFTNAGLHDRASEFYQRMLAIDNDKKVHSLYLQNLLLSASTTNQSLLLAHKDWARQHDKPWKRIHWQRRCSKQPNKKLKIGYLCHFFGNSVSQNLLLPFLKMHDRNRFEVYCYDDGETPDAYRDCADHWVDIRSYSDKEVAKIIQKDNIDILQEVNGFCIINRFGVLAHRPAPIQINWYNHTATTGLPYVDYVISDEISIQDSDLPYFVEQAYRTKQFIAAVYFDEKKFTTTPIEPPCVKNGFITFGYFGGSHKVTLPAIRLWCDVLKRVPQSRLILKCGSFTHEIYRKIFNQHFTEQGISPERILLDGWSDQTVTLKKYHEIDIMLDNIPVSGGSTMFEALLQNVPVITMMGDRWAARSGASVLTTLKHEELIAKSPEAYVDIAVKLAHDLASLTAYKQQLRTEMLASSLTSVKQCYQHFEEAYLTMWKRWIEQPRRFLSS